MDRSIDLAVQHIKWRGNGYYDPTFLSVLMDPSGETATTREAEEQDSSSGEESTIQ